MSLGCVEDRRWIFGDFKDLVTTCGQSSVLALVSTTNWAWTSAVGPYSQPWISPGSLTRNQRAIRYIHTLRLRVLTSSRRVICFLDNRSANGNWIFQINHMDWLIHLLDLRTNNFSKIAVLEFGYRDVSPNKQADILTGVLGWSCSRAGTTKV